MKPRTTRATGASRRRSLLSGDLQVLMLGNGLEAAMRFAAFVIYSHALGPAGVGLVASVLALTRLASQALELGIDTSVISLGSKEFGRGELARADQLCLAGFNLHLWIGAALLAAGLAASPLLAAGYYADPSLTPTLMVAFAGILVGRLADYNQSVLRTYQKFRPYAAAGVVAALFLLVSVTALALAHRLSVFAVVTLSLMLAPLVKFWASFPAVPAGVLRPRRPPPGTLSGIVGFGKWVYVTTLAESGVLQVNVLLLQALAGSEAAGHFHAAWRYADLLSLIFEPLRKYLVPKFTALPDHRRIRDALRGTYRWLSWTLLALPAAWLLGRPVILRVQGGEAWAPTVAVFQVLIVAVLVALLAKPLTYALFSAGRPEIQAWIQLGLLAAFAASAWWVIPRWGAQGSAMMFLGLALASFGCLAAQAHRTLHAEASAGSQASR
jgi:PST family polysaccharide transporter